MLIGYARVSKDEQVLDLQLDALAAAGVERVFTDKQSGAKADRRGLAEALSHLREGDVLTVWKLDRLGRSTIQLMLLLNQLHERGVDFKSLTEGIDTTTSFGDHVVDRPAQVRGIVEPEPPGREPSPDLHHGTDERLTC